MRLATLPEALDELDAEAVHLERERPGWGRKLLEEVGAVAALAAERPQLGQREPRAPAALDARRFPIKRFGVIVQRITGAFPQADIVHRRRMVSTIEDACAEMFSDQLGVEALDDVDAAFDRIVAREDASLVRSDAITGVTGEEGVPDLVGYDGGEHCWDMLSLPFASR